MKNGNLKFKRKKINKNIRLAILIITGLLLIFSAYSAIGSYQEPSEKKETKVVPVLSYSHMGTYDFQAHLKPNILFGANAVLKPGEATIFKKLVDHINASFNYRFQSSQDASISGSYRLDAMVQTDIWSKTTTLKPETDFNGTESTSITFEFPFNTTQYEQLVSSINDQTGVVSQSPKLILKATILIDAETSSEEIREAFAPQIQLSLNREILEFEGELTTKQVGSIEEKQVITTQLKTADQGNTWLALAVLFGFIFTVVLLFTKEESLYETQADRIYRKIDKKYGDWIVEADKLPITSELKTVAMKSFDDLIKISEELGRPVIHYTKNSINPGDIHNFYVFDEELLYKYNIPTGENIEKLAKCPKCGKKIKCHGKAGDVVKITCPSCGNKGQVTIKNSSTKNIFKKFFT